MSMFNEINNLHEWKTVQCKQCLIQITLCKINLSAYPNCVVISTFVFWQNELNYTNLHYFGTLEQSPQ
jgi:hypothetical protein